jgi:hypothetical protein
VIPLLDGERERLVKVADESERDIAGYVRWRLRAVLRAPCTRTAAGATNTAFAKVSPGSPPEST